MTTPLAQPTGQPDTSPSPNLEIAKQRLNEVRQGTPAPATALSHSSPFSKLVSSTKQLRKERQGNRSQATNILSAIQDTTLPSNL